MTHDDTRDNITRARKATRLSRVGSLAGALGLVALVLGVVGFITGHVALAAVGVVVAIVLFIPFVVGLRLKSRVRRDPAVARRTSRLRRARYRDAYPAQDNSQNSDVEDRVVGR